MLALVEHRTVCPTRSYWELAWNCDGAPCTCTVAYLPSYLAVRYLSIALFLYIHHLVFSDITAFHPVEYVDMHKLEASDADGMKHPRGRTVLTSLPIELTRRIAVRCPGRSLIALAATCRSVRSACNDALVFRDAIFTRVSWISDSRQFARDQLGGLQLTDETPCREHSSETRASMENIVLRSRSMHCPPGPGEMSASGLATPSRSTRRSVCQQTSSN